VLDWIRSQIKVYTLSQRHFTSVIERTGRSSHILFPTIWSRLSSSSRMLLSSKGSSNLSTRWTNIHVSNTTIWTIRSHPFKNVGDILSKQAATQSLRNIVVYLNRLLQSFEFLNEQNRTEELLLQIGSIFRSMNNRRFDIISFFINSFPSIKYLPSLFLNSLQGIKVYINCLLVFQWSTESSSL